MDPDRGIAALPNISKECRMYLKVAQHCAPSGKNKIDISIICNAETVTCVSFQGPTFMKVGGLFGPHLKILDPSLLISKHKDCFTKHR